MLHFSCDLCGQSLSDERYLVQIAGQAVTNDRLELDPAVEHDHLSALEASLAASADEEPPCAGLQRRYDLCPECFRKYAQDPLGRDARRRLRYSSN